MMFYLLLLVKVDDIRMRDVLIPESILLHKSARNIKTYTLPGLMA